MRDDRDRGSPLCPTREPAQDEGPCERNGAGCDEKRLGRRDKLGQRRERRDRDQPADRAVRRVEPEQPPTERLAGHAPIVLPPGRRYTQTSLPT